MTLSNFKLQSYFYYDLYRHYLWYNFNKYKDKDFLCSAEQKIEKEKRSHTTIPKTLHYIWFGKKNYPDTVKRCIDSWIAWGGVININ